MRESDFDSAGDGIGDDLANCLLDTVLDPVLDAAGKARNPGKALLKVTVCDPACGSGEFLVAAARRIARRLAKAREDNPSANAYRAALRDVVANCVYGVDVGDAAVEAAKARLRRECGEPEKGPASLDDHVKPGNSLIGTLPGLIEDGIPDSAFKPADGDDPKFARALRRANVKPAPGQRTLFSDLKPGQAGRLKRLAADAWCAAFAWVKRPDAPPAIVDRSFRDLWERGPAGVLPETLEEIERLREEHRFFHWHLEFPEIFRRGGFSCVVTDPPRDTVDRHDDRATFHFARGSGAYPECAAGLAAPGVTALRADLLFTERLAALIGPKGRAGCAAPAAVSVSPGGQCLFRSLTNEGALASLYEFEDRSCLITTAGPEARVDAARYAFSLRDTAELKDPERTFTLTPDEITLLNPNTGSVPAFRGRRDAGLTTAVYRRLPVLWDETRDDGNPWKMRLAPAFFRTRSDSGLFRAEEELRDGGWELADGVFTRGGERALPVYEAPMVRPFDPQHGPPRHWILEPEIVTERLKELGWRWEWLCGWRAAVPPDDERTAVAAFLPRAPVTESFPLMMPRSVPPLVACLIAAQSSLVFDFLACQKLGISRQKPGGGARIRPSAWKQLPAPTPRMMEPHLSFVVPRVTELVYTSEEMAPLARDLDDTGSPFAWDDGRRAELRAELDAFFFRLYGITGADDVAYILESFPAEPARLILDAHHRLADAAESGSAYQTRIIPSPGRGARVSVNRHPGDVAPDQGDADDDDPEAGEAAQEHGGVRDPYELAEDEADLD